MKKPYIPATVLLIIFLLFPKSAISQDKDFGVRAGWQAASTKNDGDKIDGNLGSFYVGVFRVRPIGPTKILTWVGGIEYSQQGHKDDKETYRKIHYISLPLALRVKVGPVSVQGGGNFNFRIAEKVEIDGMDIDDNSKFFDLALHLGAGFNLGRLGLEARYHWGLLDVNDGNKNQYLQLGGSLRIF